MKVFFIALLLASLYSTIQMNEAGAASSYRGIISSGSFSTRIASRVHARKSARTECRQRGFSDTDIINVTAFCSERDHYIRYIQAQQGCRANATFVCSNN